MSLTPGVFVDERCCEMDDLGAYARDTELRALDLVDKLTNFRDQLIERIKTYEEVEDERIARGVLNPGETEDK